MNRALVLLGALLLATPAAALDPTRALTQARLSVWTSEAGLPQATIYAIVQTSDGYLWMGTEEGLVRFDGVRFVVTDRQNAPALRSPFISSLFEAPDRTLWIGTYGGGVARLRHGALEAFHPEILGTDRIRKFLTTRDGSIFVATAGGGLLRFDGEKVTRFTTRDGLPSDRIWTIADDGDGGFWVATYGGGVVRWRDGRVLQRITTREGLPNDVARALLLDDDGTLWIGTDGGGLAAWRAGRIVRTITTRDGLPNDFVRTLRRDRNGSLWIGTDGGLARWRGARATAMTIADGLPSNGVRELLEDREGSLWIGTAAGLVRMRDTRVLPYTRKEGLPVDAARALVETRDGRVWVGTEGGGLCEVLPGPVQCRTTADGLPHNTPYALIESRDGSLWVGTDGGGVARFRDGKFIDRIDSHNAGLPNDRVRALVETAQGDLWVSLAAGLVLVHDGRATRVPQFDDRQLRPLLALPDGELLVGTDGAGLWRVSGPTGDPSPPGPGEKVPKADEGGLARVNRPLIRPFDSLRSLRGTFSPRGGEKDLVSVNLVATLGRGLESDRVFSLTMDSAGGGVWIGTSGGGLARLDLNSGTVRSLTRRNGLYDDVVFHVVDTGADLWLTSNRGVYRVSRERVLAAMNGAKPDLRGTIYGIVDGMPSAECNGAFPGAMSSRDGRVWIATSRGVAVINPAANIRNEVPPLVHVEEVLVDGVKAAGGQLRVPSGTQRLELRYTALSLRAPEHVTFRYMLEGYDRGWVNAGGNRVATYTKLAPGNYTFRVTAANEDGVRSDGEARFTLTVVPRWFETWWARLLGLVLLAAALWALVRLRLATLHKRHAELEAIVAERTAELEVANERLRALSYVDGLTGVANRRRFDEALADACAAANGAPVSLVLLDLDHFKKLNDSQGHQDGDEALRAVAALLAERTKSRGGLAARFGGEEFAWLLPGIALDEAKAEAETLRRQVRDARIRHSGAEHGVVTASFGVSSGIGPTPPALVAAADAALYRAKSGGRDRVEAGILRPS